MLVIALSLAPWTKQFSFNNYCETSDVCSIQLLSISFSAIREILQIVYKSFSFKPDYSLIKISAFVFQVVFWSSTVGNCKFR